jgi:hypothetical protein
VVVHARAEEADLRLGVPVTGRQSGQVLVDLLLGLPLRKVELAAEPHRLRDVREQILEGADADGVEHLLQILVCNSRVAAHEPPRR